MQTELITLDQKRKVTLTAYIQEVKGEFLYISKRPAILILPGGGYQYCSGREADPVAMPYLKAGYQVFILRYSVKEDAVWPNPLDDYEQAMELIRSNDDKWHLYKDKVAVIGFSAGGHLAACAATMAKNKPDAAILGYAVTKGEMIHQCEPTAPDVVSAVSFDTSPCFLFATRTDQVVPITNTIEFTQALVKYDISFESHIYAYGPHGFSTGDPSVQYKDTSICSRAPHWVEDSIQWLKDMFGDFGENSMAKPACRKHVTSDYDDVLSVECTFGYLRHYKNAEKVMTPFITWLEEHKEEVARHIGPATYERTCKYGIEGLYQLADSRTFLEVLSNTKLSQEDVDRIDSALQAIPNVRK